MQKFLSFFFLLSLATLCCGSASSDCISKDGVFRGIKLSGRVQIVSFGEDFKVRHVSVGEDLIVQISDCATPSDEPGKWRFVRRNGDFKVRFVDRNEDVRIRFSDRDCGVSTPCPDKKRPR